MARIGFCSVVAVMASLLAGVVSGARTQELPPAVVAVLDFNYLRAQSAAAKDARRQIDAYRDAYQAEIAKGEEALRKEREELSRQRAILAPEAFAEKRRAFEREVTRLQRQVRDRSRLLEQTWAGIRKEIGREVTKIVADLAGEKKFNVILDRAQVLMSDEKLDITANVLGELDRRLPSIKVPPPEGE